MKDFIKVTKTEDTGGGVIWISKYQIKYLTPDEMHFQTYIKMQNEEIKSVESIDEILNQLE